MNHSTLERISALLAEARGLLDELDYDNGYDEDHRENWLYMVESIESQIDDYLEEES